MSASIDQRIVEMQFDNKQFEDGIQTSLKSLDNLEKGLQLKDGAKGLENIGKTADNLSFDGLNSGIYAVQQKFSAMEIVAITALTNITNKAINAGEQLVKSLSVDQISAGWQKYADKTTSVATLLSQGYDIDTVNEQLDLLNTFTDETSYNFTDMVSSISKFTAAGKDLPESVTAMEGIATWAALSGQNAATASRAMYQLSQAMGAGVMKRQDYMSIQNANMDTAEFRQHCIDAGIALGTLRKEADGTFTTIVDGAKEVNFTQSQFMESLTEGQWLNSDVMMKVFTSYASAANGIFDAADKRGMLVSEAIDEIHTKADELKTATMSDDDAVNAAIKELGYTLEDGTAQFDAFALKALEAAQKARTFNDAIDSVKDAVSTSWMNTFQIIFGDAEQATRLWTDLANDLYDIFASGGEARNDYLSKVFGEQSSAFTEAQWKTVEETGQATDELKKALMETAKEHGIAIDEMIDGNTSFEESLKKGWLTADIFTETIKKSTDATTKNTEALNAKLEEYKQLAKDVIQGDYGNGAARKKALEDAGQDYATIQGIVNKMLAGTEITIEDLSEEQLKSIGYTNEQVAAFKELAEQAEKTGTPINEMLASLEKPSGRDLLIETFANALHGLMGVIESVKTAWSEAFPAPTAERLYSIIERLNRFSKKLVLSEENSDKLRRSLRGLFDVLGIVTDVVGKLANSAMKVLNAVFSDTNLNVLDYTANIGDNLTKLRAWIKSNETLNKVVDNVTDTLIRAVKAVKNWIKEHELVQKMLSIVSKAFTVLGNAIIKTIEILSKWWKSFTQLPIVQKAVEVFGEIFTKILETIGNLLKNIEPAIDGLLDKLSNFEGIKLDSIIGFFKSFGQEAGNPLDFVKGKLEGVNGAIDVLKQKAQNAFEKVKNLTEPVHKLFSDLQTIASGGVVKFFKNLAWEKLLAALAGLGVIKSLTKLSTALSGVAKAVNSGFTDMLGSITGFFKAMTKQVQADVIMKTAIAVGIFAGSLAALAFVPQDNLRSAAITLGVFSAAILGLANALPMLGQFLTAKGILGASSALSGAGIAAVLVSFGAAVLMIVKALKELDQIENVEDNLTIVGGIIAAMGAVLIAISQFSKVGGVTTAGALTLVSVAASVKLIVSTLEDIQGFSYEQILDALGKIGLIILAMLATSGLAKGGSKGAAATIVAAAIGLKLIVSTFAELSEMPLKGIVKSLAVVVTILTMLGAVTKACNAANKDTAAAGKNLILMSAGVFIIVEAIKSIAEINNADIVKGIAVIDAMMVIFVAMGAAGRLAGSNAKDAGIGIAAMSASIFILAGAIKLLTTIDDYGKMAAAIAAIEALMLGFMGVMFVSKYAASGYKSIIAMAACISALAIVMVALSTIPVDTLGPATIALDSLMGCFAIVLAASNLAKGATLSIVAITAAVVVLGLLLKYMADTPNPEAYVPIAMSLGGLMLALSGSLAIIGAIPAAMLAKAVVVMEGLMLFFVAAAEAFGYLMNNSSLFKENLQGAVEFFGLIGEMVGTFIGKIGEGISNSLPAIGKNLESFGASLQVFMDNISSIDDGAGNKIGIVADGVGKLLGIQVWNGLARLTSGNVNFETVKTNMKALGDGVSAFASATSGVTKERITAAAEATGAIANVLHEMPSEGGLWGKIFGEKMDLGTFGEKLTKLGEGLAGYCAAISKDGAIDKTAVDSSVSAAESLAGLQNELPETGGKLQDWLGEKSLSSFGSQLGIFATGLVRYSQIITGGYGGSAFNSEAVTNSADAATMLAELESKLPETGGLLQTILGEQDLGGLGNSLVDFAEGMVAYSNALTSEGGIDTEAVTASKTAIEMVIGLAKSANEIKSGKWLSAFLGDGTLSSLGEELAAFAPNFLTYSDATTKMSVVSMRDAKDAMSDILTVCQDFAGVDVGIITRLSDALNSFTPNSSFAANLGSDNYEGLKEAGKNFINAVTEGMDLAMVSGAPEKIYNHVQTLIDSVTRAMFQGQETMQLNVQSIVDALFAQTETSITSNTPGVMLALADLMTHCITFLTAEQHQWYVMGAYLVTGLAQGISDNGSAAIDAAVNVAKKSLEAAKRTLDEHSPSKKTYEMGKFFDLGMANGIRDYGSDVSKRAGTMAENVLAKLSTMMASDLDTTPTIRPVMDLTDVEEGLDGISTLFGGKTLSIGGSVNRARSAVAVDTTQQSPDTNQNGSTVNYTFEQNNYSPKALDRLEIYRQTRNQFAMMKGVKG